MNLRGNVSQNVKRFRLTWYFRRKYMDTIRQRMCAAATLAGILIAGNARAQVAGTAPAPQGSSPAASSARQFLAVDVFGGYMSLDTYGDSTRAEDEAGADVSERGFEMGGTVRFRPWLGIT